MILTLKCTSPVGTTSPPGYSPAWAPCCLPPRSFLSSARPVHLPDPQRFADPLTRVKQLSLLFLPARLPLINKPFTSVAVSSPESQSSLPYCPSSGSVPASLRKRTKNISLRPCPPSAPILAVLAPAASLMQTPKRSEINFFALSDFKSDLICVQMPRKNKTPDPIQQEVFTTKYQLQLRTELWFLYSYNKLVVRDEKHRRLQRGFSAEHAYPHIHTLIYIRALPVVLQLSAACQGKKIY